MSPDAGILSLLCYAALFMLGWRMVGVQPEFQKYVLIGAPHTSNWDFLYIMLFKYASGVRFKWIGKNSLFKFPHGVIFRLLGGIPVVRDAKSNFVAQIANLFASTEKLVIAIAPEGTRQQKEYWRTGFYYMALGSQVPIVLGFLDYPRKQIGLGPVLYPTGDIHSDFRLIQDFYADKQGAYPGNKNRIALAPVAAADAPASPAAETNQKE